MILYTILDELTSSCIESTPLLPKVGVLQLRFGRPDILFVESAWHGWHNAWKGKIATYVARNVHASYFPSCVRSWYIRLTHNNRSLIHLLEYAKKRGIPTVFWDKEGLVHFDRFINAARHFDHVFTVDADTIPKYKEVMGQNASVHVLPFAVQPRFHFFDGFHFEKNEACFVGSYSTHIHHKRRAWQDILFQSAFDTGLGLTVYDRNSSRRAKIFRYPELPGVSILPSVSNAQTAGIYKKYLVSLNVNTNETSPTMVSRRLVEILACGGIAVTNPTPAVDNMFREYCHVVHNREEADALFSRLRHGPSQEDLERAKAGADYIARNHTWEIRLKQIADIVGIDPARC